MTPSATGTLVQTKGETLMKTTKVMAKEILNLWKDDTNYFNGRLTEEEFENMLIYQMHFGQAEAITITMALILAGAKFKSN